MQSQKVSNQNYQWLSEASVQKLFRLAFVQFKEETYDINKVARYMINFIDEVAEMEKQYNSSSLQTTNQILYFCSLLGSSPKYFIQLLNEEIITSHSHIITINSRNQLIAKRFLAQFKSHYGESQQFPDYMRNEKLTRQMYSFINVAANKMCKVYEESSQILKDCMNGLTQKIKKSKIMNNFILYKIFREISVSTKKIVQQKCTETVFRNCPSEVIQQFFHYIINKFQVIKLLANQQISHSMFEPSPIIFFNKFEKHEQIELLPKQAVNSQGKFAIFVKTYSQNESINNSLQDYLLILDDDLNLRVLNCKTLRKKWYIINDIQTNIRLTLMAKQYILEGQFSIDSLRKNNKGPIQSLLLCQPLDSYTNFNGVMGRCLYLMKRYTGVSQFFKDLSKRAILAKSMEQLMNQIPVVGYMIMAGTFSANFYKIFSNKFSTDSKKLKQFGGFMLNTTTTVGTSILGAITGQMLIPIPVVGALIGSVIGGFIGDKGGKQINSWISKKKFLQTIKYLQKQQIDQQYWMCTPGFYKILQIKESQFQSYIPTYMQDFVFATLIGFVLACFYQSKRLNDFNLSKSKKIFEDKSKQDSRRWKEKQFEQEIHKMNLQEDFETQFNIMRIVQFLQKKNAYLYEHYETLEVSILTNLSKIIN